MNELTLFTPIKTDMAPAIADAKSVKKIETHGQALAANMTLKQVKAILAAAKNLKDTLKRPHIDANKMIDEQFNRIAKEIGDAETHLKQLLIAFNAAEERKKEEERKILEEKKRKEDEARQLAAARDVTPAVDDFDALLLDDKEIERKAIIQEANAEVEQYVADKQHVAAMKQLDQKVVKGIRTVTRFEVQNEDEVPRKFLMVDEQALRKHFAENPQSIVPGVRSWPEQVMAAR